ncbi:hypothetical protein TNCT_240441 [Trichonephila clavata]|uniref:Uncharacterized protein n=1 Tax=Trichonephila clavata TaxID=2740835 RepID=A0A8X6LWT0_TRICU|nr:hypothetical protein TNCT_240441 [Trichonephila clavata]
MKTPEAFAKVSPFLIEKAISSSVGPVPTFRKILSRELFLEVSSSKQATALIKLQKPAHLDITVAPHTNLSFSRGVISAVDLLSEVTDEILENLKAQEVLEVSKTP